MLTRNSYQDRNRTFEAAQEKRSFASFKFDWMKALAVDPRLDARAKMIGNCILNHVNQHSGEATLSDRAISDETAIPLRGIVRGRGPLRKLGWIDWRRTGGANIYRVLSNPMLAMKDRLARLKSQRDTDPSRRKAARVAPPVAQRNHRGDTPPVAERKDDQQHEIGQIQRCDAPAAAEHVRPPVADKHLSVTPTSTPIVPPRFARRPLRGIGFEEAKEGRATTVDHWLATTTKEERTAELLPYAQSIGLNHEQTVALADEFVAHHRSRNVASENWYLLCRDWFRTSGRRLLKGGPAS